MLSRVKPNRLSMDQSKTLQQPVENQLPGTPAAGESTAHGGEHHPANRGAGNSAEAIALVGTLLLAAGVRLWGLGREALWADETASLRAASGSLYDVLVQYHHYENTPPLYYLLLNLFGRLFGTMNDAVIRLPSVIFGTLGVLGVWWLVRAISAGYPTVESRRDRSALVGPIVAALIAALSLQQIWFSQEARAYSLFAMASLMSSTLLLRALNQPTVPRCAAYVMASIVMCYSHFAAAGVLMAHCFCGVVAVARSSRLDRWAFVATQCAIGLACLPLIPTALKTRGRMIGFSDRTLSFAAEKFADTYLWLFDNVWVLLPVICLAAVGVIKLRATISSKVLVAGLILLPPLPPLIGWYTGGAQYFSRHALPSGLALAVAVGMGLAALPRRAAWTTGAAVVAGVILSLIAGREHFRKPAMREAAAFVAAHAHPGDTIICSFMLTGWSFDRYFDRTDVRRRNYDEFTIAQLARSGEGIDRIWVVFFQVPSILEPYLKENPMQMTVHQSFHEILVLRFDRPLQGNAPTTTPAAPAG